MLAQTFPLVLVTDTVVWSLGGRVEAGEGADSASGGLDVRGFRRAYAATAVIATSTMVAILNILTLYFIIIFRWQVLQYARNTQTRPVSGASCLNCVRIRFLVIKGGVTPACYQCMPTRGRSGTQRSDPEKCIGAGRCNVRNL